MAAADRATVAIKQLNDALDVLSKATKRTDDDTKD